MTHQIHDTSGSTARGNRHRVLTLASALLFSAGAIMGSLPALAGDNNAENSAGEGSFDHSGIYSFLLAPHGDFTGTSATSTADRRLSYLAVPGRVPLKFRSGRSVRGN
jgi:hypothetical protein